jgi:Bacterial Ig-like domain
MGHPGSLAPVVALLFAAAAAPVAAQVSEYEMRYGEPVDVSLDSLLSMPESYEGRAVRTHGTLNFVPGSQGMAYYMEGTLGGRLYLAPVSEVGYQFEHQARLWIGKELEVTGGVERGSDPVTSTGQPVSNAVYLRMWGYVGPPDEKKAGPAGAVTTLEDLVTRPGELDGKTVTVRGQFRGENLFGDLPSKSRRRSSDWVIKEELFAAWVTGHKPKGSGFNLDADLKRDTGKWLQVTGRVSTVKGVVYLEATDVILSAPTPAVAKAEPPPPPPPRPKKPPVVVFSLPLDGEREVPANTVFRVQFSKDMDEDSLKDRVVLRYAGRPQPGDRDLDAVHVSYDRGLRTLEVDPGDLLRPGRIVELLLLPGIQDIDGLSLETRPGRKAGAAADVLRFQIAQAGFMTGPSR